MKKVLITLVFFTLLSCKSDNKKILTVQPESEFPNFIFILVDDQGWNGTSVQMMANDSLSKSDYYQTPNLEKLAAKGMIFSNAYAAAPVCAPSRYSIQFGQTPARLSLVRVGMNSDHIDHENLTSIPKALKLINPKYITAHFGKWGMGSNPETIGYDQSDGATQNKEGGFVNNKTQWDFSVHKDPKQIFSLTNKANEFMERSVKENKPFYMQVSHYAVHSSLQMRQKSLDKYLEMEKGKYQNNPGLAAMTEDLDEGVGLVLEKMKSLGIENNTYIIYMSDNGGVPNIPGAKKYDNSYNYPLSRGKWDAMEGGVRVPLIINGPGIIAGSENNIPLSSVDILPTIVDLANGKITFENIDGGSFKDNLLGEENNEIKRPVEGIFFHVPYVNKIAIARAHSAVRKGDFKLIKFRDSNQVVLYNLKKDKKELINLADSLPEKTKSLENILENYLVSVHAPKWKQGINWKEKPLKEFNSSY